MASNIITDMMYTSDQASIVKSNDIMSITTAAVSTLFSQYPYKIPKCNQTKIE